MSKRSQMNYHITWTDSGTISSAWTDADPGAYPATDTSAAHIVAPGDFVRAYCAKHDPADEYAGTAEEAARAWARQEGHYCA